MPNLTDPTIVLSTYQLQVINVQEILFRVKQSLQLVNNFVQRTRYQKIFSDIEKSFQNIKILLNTDKADTLLSVITSQWQELINKLTLQCGQLQAIGHIDDHDRDILLSLTTMLLESLKLPVQNDNQNVQANSALTLTRLAMTRLVFEESLDHIKQIKEAELSPSCFISYAWGASHIKTVHQMAEDLKRAGIEVKLDIWHNLPGTSITKFAEQITKTDYVILMGSTLLRKKYDAGQGNVLFIELGMLASRYKYSADTIQPAIIEGDAPENAFPPYMNGGSMAVFIDLRKEEQYFSECLKLIQSKLLEFSDKQTEIAQLIRTFEEKQALIQNDKISSERLELFAKEVAARQQAKEKALLAEIDKVIDGWHNNNSDTKQAENLQAVGLFAVQQHSGPVAFVDLAQAELLPTNTN